MRRHAAEHHVADQPVATAVLHVVADGVAAALLTSTRLPAPVVFSTWSTSDSRNAIDSVRWNCGRLAAPHRHRARAARAGRSRTAGRAASRSTRSARACSAIARPSRRCRGRKRSAGGRPARASACGRRAVWGEGRSMFVAAVGGRMALGCAFALSICCRDAAHVRAASRAGFRARRIGMRSLRSGRQRGDPWHRCIDARSLKMASSPVRRAQPAIKIGSNVGAIRSRLPTANRLRAPGSRLAMPVGRQSVSAEDACRVARGRHPPRMWQRRQDLQLRQLK